MHINQIIVLKETRENEGRVALTPKMVQKLTNKNYSILVESHAGKLAGFTDEEYRKAGAGIFNFGENKFPAHSLILRVKCPSLEREVLENNLFSNDTVMMGFLDPFDVMNNKHMQHWHALNIHTISLELLDFNANDPKNAQAAMSRIAGELAFEDANERYRGLLPKKVTILGTGPAALSAAHAAKKLQLPVQVFGRKESYRQMIEEKGFIYHVLPETKQAAFIRQYLTDQTIIIAAARSAGQKSPLLIDEESLAIMPDNSVIVDLSAGEGGCVIGSREDAIIKNERGILIINVSGYPKARPRIASEAFAECIVNLLLEMMPNIKEINLKSYS